MAPRTGSPRVDPLGILAATWNSSEASLALAPDAVSADGKTLTVTNKGSGSKGPFEVVMVLERVVPDPY